MEAIESKARKAAIRLLVRRGYEIIDEGAPADVFQAVAIDGEDGTLVFVAVSVREGHDTGFPKPGVAREALEVAAAGWLAEHRERTDVRVRFDSVAIVALSEDRAFARLHVNAFGAA